MRKEDGKFVTVPYKCVGINNPHFFNVDVPEEKGIPNLHGCNLPDHNTAIPIRVTRVGRENISEWTKRNLEE
jgi:hypothetical protein